MSGQRAVVLDVEQNHHESARSGHPEGGHVGRVGCDLHALEQEDGVEADHADRDHHEDHHRPGCVLLNVVQQQVQGHRRQGEEDPVHQVGDDAHADEFGVRGDVPSCGRGIASDVQLGVYEAFGKAAEDADQ